MAQIEPPELAALVHYAERPREDDWSLRAALNRYAQPQPQRASRLLAAMRRLDAGLGAHTKAYERDGTSTWAALADDGDGPVVGILRAALEVDRFGDVLAAWAATRQGERPDAAVDAVTDDLERRLDALGVPVEEGPPPRGARGRG